ncbi:MAG: 1-acyl-sn-glycerol-3-phosphate acyltransferase [Clostridia bacterium]|nr:1-acyl-sn-glycerol-3-phosphate acyltransferase [Clostridia bacterium]
MNLISSIVKWYITKVFTIKVTSAENMPQEGGCILCSNHISNFDPVVLGCAMERPVRFIAKQELFKIPVVGWYLKSINIIPVKRGSGDIGAVKASLRALKDGEVLGIFPTGTREKKHPDAQPKPGVALIAAKADVPVIPVHIDASYKPFSKVSITVGKPVDMSGYTGRKLNQEELADAACHIYSSIKALGGAL